jgi:hypothetical protein
VTHEQRIRLALAAWLDYWPWPETWTGELQRRSTSSGPAPFRRVRCATCKGSGRLRGGWVCRDCEGRGVYDVDAYTGLPVDTAETPWEDLLRGVVRCSRCAGTSAQCPRCNGSGVERAPFAGKVDMTGGLSAQSTPGRRNGDAVLDALDREHEKRDGLDCYRQLEAAMASLHDRDRPAHWTVAWVLVWQQQPEATLLEGPRRSLDRGLRFLVEAVRPPLDLPGDVYAAWEARQAALAAAKGKRAARPAQRARDDEIRALYATGNWSQTHLARTFNVTQARVSQIVAGGLKVSAAAADISVQTGSSTVPAEPPKGRLSSFQGDG